MIAPTTNSAARATTPSVGLVCALLIATAGCATSSYRIFNFAHTKPAPTTLAQTEPAAVVGAPTYTRHRIDDHNLEPPITTTTSRVIPVALTQPATEEVPP